MVKPDGVQRGLVARARARVFEAHRRRDHQALRAKGIPLGRFEDGTTLQGAHGKAL